MNLPATLLGDTTALAFLLHVGGGTIGLFSGTVALFARKGGRLHRKAGTVFFASMLVMAAFATWLAVVRPGQIVNLFIGAFAAYLIATAWLTVRRQGNATALADKIAFGVILCLLAPFAFISFDVAVGVPLPFKSAVPMEGPVLIALYVFTSVIAIAAVSDAKVMFAGGISGAPRIARHLWRMCLGLAMAAGSAFTNGLPRLLPGPMHVTTIDFLPQFIPILLLVYWMIRVRFTGWFARRPAIQPV